MNRIPSRHPPQLLQFMVQITKGGFQTALTSVASLRETFERQSYVRLPGFLSPEILSLVEPRISAADFFERIDEGPAATRELCMAINSGLSTLLLLVNDDNLFQLIQDITGCPRIRCFEGRVYKFVGGAGHYHRWHNDVVENRLVAMSVNLGGAYNGGVLQIRERDSKRMLVEVTNAGKGDAIIFRLSKQLEHRITEVTQCTKITFAGWFKGEGSFLPTSSTFLSKTRVS